eukprot:2717848-Lingulodinium_polyedra.AAC.1
MLFGQIDGFDAHEVEVTVESFVRPGVFEQGFFLLAQLRWVLVEFQEERVAFAQRGFGFPLG